MTEDIKVEETQARRGRPPRETVAEPVIAPLSGKTVTISIPASENNSKSVCGSINGVQFNIPRGKPIDVPVEILGVLNDANVVNITADGRLLGSTNRFNAQLLAA